MNLDEPLHLGDAGHLLNSISNPLVKRRVSHWRVVSYAIPVNVTHDAPYRLLGIEAVMRSEAIGLAHVAMQFLHIECNGLVIPRMQSSVEILFFVGRKGSRASLLPGAVAQPIEVQVATADLLK